MRRRLVTLLNNQQSGLIIIILAIGIALSIYAPTYTNRISGEQGSTFLNASTLMQAAKDASFFAIMAVGATIVIISGGIDLSVGSIYALSGVTIGLVMQEIGSQKDCTWERGRTSQIDCIKMYVSDVSLLSSDPGSVIKSCATRSARST